MTFVLPSSLKPGDKIAILSPSAGMAYLFPWVYEQGLERIQKIFNLIPIEYPTARQSPEFLSKNPQARAKDLNAAFADSSIKGIFATIGGNDQIRILPYLNKKIISSNPKIFMGYSDCTNLHLFLWNLGIVSYYGGAVMTQFAYGGGMHDYTIKSIEKNLFYPPCGQVYSAQFYSDADLNWADKNNLNMPRPTYPCTGWLWYNTAEQIIEGTLWGGCLEVLSLHLSVRKYLPDFEKLRNTILFIETSEEMPTQEFVYCFIAALAEIGILKNFQAILVAYPKAQFCDKLPPEGRQAYILNQQTAIKNALRDYEVTIPVIFNMNFGHTDPQMIIPNGGQIKINCKTKTVDFF